MYYRRSYLIECIDELMWCCLNQIQFFTKFISCYYNVIHVQVDSSDILNISLSFAVAVSSSNQLLQDTVLTPVVAAMAGTGTGTGTASGRRSLLAAFNATSTSVQAAKIAKVQQLNIAAAAANIAALVCVGGGGGGAVARQHSVAWGMHSAQHKTRQQSSRTIRSKNNIAIRCKKCYNAF